LYLGMSQTDPRAGAASDTELSYDAFGGTYDAGFAKFGLLYARADANTNSNKKDRKQTIINAVFPVGNGVSIHAAAMNTKADGADNKASGFSLVAVKALSKRTSIYGGYTDVNNKAGSQVSWSLTGAAASAIAADADPAAFAVGISHTF